MTPIDKVSSIGNSLLIQQGADVATSAQLGPFVYIADGAHVGENVSIEGLCIVPGHVRLEAGARIGRGVSFIESGPSSKQSLVKEGAVIGANAIIWPDLTIGHRAVIAPGVEIKRSIPALAIVEGNPARITGYVETAVADMAKNTASRPAMQTSIVKGVTLHQMPRVVDIRGSLTVGEANASIPFHIQRYFMVFDVPSQETRGEHAHRECHQFLICVRGSCAVVADDGSNRQEFLLDRPDLGLHLPPMTWGIQYKYSADAVLLVLASHNYDNADYIRDYNEFLRLSGATA